MSKPVPTYHLRIREDGEKKSKFIPARSPKDARDAYKGKGTVMWCRKVGTERLFEIGEFFRLGDDLLREINATSSEPSVVAARQQNQRTQERVMKRRSFDARSTAE